MRSLYDAVLDNNFKSLGRTLLRTNLGKAILQGIASLQFSS